MRPVVCEQRPTDRVKENYSIDMMVLKTTEWQGHEHLCHTGMPVRNGNLDTDRTTTTKATSVRKQLGMKNSKINEGRQANNGVVKGRDGSAEDLDREMGEEQITARHVEITANDRLPKIAAELREHGRGRRGRPRLRGEDCVKREVRRQERRKTGRRRHETEEGGKD